MSGADANAGGSSRPFLSAPPRSSHVGLIVAAVLVVYANALPNAFLWDDLHLVVGNPAIKSLEHLRRALVGDLFPATLPSGYYRPLQTLSYALDYRVWGLAPFGFHLTNVLLHAATAALLYVVGVRVLRAPAAALAGTLLFAVHPVHVEAVTYVAGRSDPLSAVFLLLAVLGFLRGDHLGRLGSIAAFALALLAREAALVLPLLLVVVDRAAPAGPRRPWRAYLPYGAVLVAWVIVRHLAVGTTEVAVANAGVPLGLRVLTLAEVIVRYLGLLVVPLGLHMERVVPVAAPFAPTTLAALGAVLTLVVGVVALRVRVRPLAFGVAWFLVALLPVANLVPLATFMAEHWLYVPLMGLALAAGWCLTALPPARWRRPMLLACGLLVVAYGATTIRRNADWRDARTLYEHLLPLAPASLRVRINLAQAYQEAGELERARLAYEEVLRRHPADAATADAANNLGNLHRDAGRFADALAAYDRAIGLQPRHVAARNGRALVLQQTGRVDEAERALHEALALVPAAAITHSNLGNLYFRRDEIARARDEYLAALALDPDLADAHNNLGSAYFRLGERGLAAARYREALRLDPGSAGARRNLAIVTGEPTEPGEPASEPADSRR